MLAAAATTTVERGVRYGGFPKDDATNEAGRADWQSRCGHGRSFRDKTLLSLVTKMRQDRLPSGQCGAFNDRIARPSNSETASRENPPPSLSNLNKCANRHKPSSGVLTPRYLRWHLYVADAGNITENARLAAVCFPYGHGPPVQPCSDPVSSLCECWHETLSSWSLVLCVLVAVVSSCCAGEQPPSSRSRVTTTRYHAGRCPVIALTRASRRRTTASDVMACIWSEPAPGEYTLVFEMDGLAKQQRAVRVPLGGTATIDAGMTIVIEETVQVTALAQPAWLQPRTSQNFVQSETVLLPVGRSPFLIADLASGLTDNTPNANQVTISGAFAYDNVWLINGVDVNDNVLGSSNNLFVEEAIGEVQVLTSGISAEYGRFSGGVINVITRSGGNSFSGGFRLNLSNPSWSAETPFETSQRTSKLSKVHEGIIGGPLLKDQLWFFGAGRWERSSTQGAFPQTAAPLVTETDNDRYELKLTGALSPGHTLRGSFVDNDLTGAQASLPFSIDPRAYVHPHTPNRLFVANYAGVVGSRLLATAQYSRKHWGVRNNGNRSTDILDSPFLTRTGTMYQYNAPYFDSTDPEDRNNHQATASLAYFASTARLAARLEGRRSEQFTSRGRRQPQTSTATFPGRLCGRPQRRAALDAMVDVPRSCQDHAAQTWMPVRGARRRRYDALICRIGSRQAAICRSTWDSATNM